ncbi:helix-turn-helix domain-containing protein [Rhodococcus hoagii]|nr:helix-turn-helix domain-containing protein [Prescottella equi]
MNDLFVIPLDQAFLGDLRVRRGLLQEDLAKRLGVSVQLVGLIERGQGSLREELAERWAEALSHDLPFRDDKRRTILSPPTRCVPPMSEPAIGRRTSDPDTGARVTPPNQTAFVISLCPPRTGR